MFSVGRACIIQEIPAKRGSRVVEGIQGNRILGELNGVHEARDET